MLKTIKKIFQFIKFILEIIICVFAILSSWNAYHISEHIKKIFEIKRGDDILNYITNPIVIETISILVFSLFISIFVYKIQRKSEEKIDRRNKETSKNTQQPLIVLKNENNNQSGGASNQTINLGKPPRRLTKKLESELNKFDKKSKFYIHVKLDDDEAQNLAYQIKNFLKKEGFDYCGMTAHGMTGGNAEIVIQKENNEEKISIIIGANEITNRPLKQTGYSMGID